MKENNGILYHNILQFFQNNSIQRYYITCTSQYSTTVLYLLSMIGAYQYITHVVLCNVLVVVPYYYCITYYYYYCSSQQYCIYRTVLVLHILQYSTCVVINIVLYGTVLVLYYYCYYYCIIRGSNVLPQYYTIHIQCSTQYVVQQQQQYYTVL